MDWITKMNAAVAYIEANLAGEIDMHEAGKIAGCSAYHFQRVFSYMANTTLAEYIRRRRLTMAAFDLQNGAEKVIDVALRYGYESPTSFTRAFAALHGVTPSEAKKMGANFVSYPKLSFQITIQGVSAMNYKMEQKEGFTVIGFPAKVTMKDDQALQDIPSFWAKAAQNEWIPKLCAHMDMAMPGVMGFSMPAKEGEGYYEYVIGVVTKEPAPKLEGAKTYRIGAHKWAIFTCEGPMPDAMQNTQRRIYREWLPSSNYAIADGPDIEQYMQDDVYSEDSKNYVWLPVVEKE